MARAMMMRLFHLMDPETGHRLAVRGSALLPAALPLSPTGLNIRVAGIDFPNPVGLAAGLDKDAEATHAWPRYGFGFCEVGTLTPRAQVGNPKPRLFRLTADRAVINRMGFNNGGQQAARERLSAARRAGRLGVVGVNIGANKDSVAGDGAIQDYVAGVRLMAPVADYLTINISSPNTPGLRKLQDASTLGDLLAAVTAARDATATRPPVFLKVAPDLEPADIDAITAAVIAHHVDALIIGNTTLSRPPLVSRDAGETGGLSGAPLRTLAAQRLRDFAIASGRAFPLIAAGGIDSVEEAWSRLRHGASLIQLYSALVYQGPWLAAHIVRRLEQRLRLDGIRSIAEIIGADL